MVVVGGGVVDVIVFGEILQRFFQNRGRERGGGGVK